MISTLRIAMIGCRGVPATYGGIERHVEEIGARLADRGHQVTVYSRTGYTDARGVGEYRGMRTVALPAVGTKHLEALSHSALAVGHALRARHDVFHFHAVGPGLFTPLTKVARGGSSVLTIHGLDFDRGKWSPLARRLLRQGERVGARTADALVVVAPGLVQHYRDRYGVEATYIPNGVAPPAVPPGRRADRYVLFVGRLTPEKGPHLLIEAFSRQKEADMRLVVVGGSSHTDDFVDELRAAASRDTRIELRGYVFGRELEELYAGTRLFVQPSSLEGMPLTVLEAASYGVPLLTSDIPVHSELLGTPGPGRRLFRSTSVGDLETQLRDALHADDEAERRAAGAFGEEVVRRYRWDAVTDELEELYLRTIARVRLGRKARA